MSPNRATGVLGLGLALGLVITACGGGSKSPGVATLSGSTGPAGHSSTTATTSTKNATQLMHDWANCMRQHGVQMADPTVSGQGQVNVSISGGGKPAQGTFQAADTACRSLHNQAMVALGGTGPSIKPDPTKLLAFSRCMRAHGVPDFPDPSSGGGVQLQGGAGSDLNPNNPAFQAAQNACQSLLGSLKGGTRIQVNGGGPGAGSGVVSGAVAGGTP
jgi:hypothetical protein